jgi:hypothetical protein
VGCTITSGPQSGQTATKDFTITIVPAPLVQPCPPTCPNPAATPELDSLVLFVSGAFGLAGYALVRRRARRG